MEARDPFHAAIRVEQSLHGLRFVNVLSSCYNITKS